jgi:cystathionine beta-synthase
MDLKLLDDVIQVSDQECFVWARKMARMEGIFAGGSSGGAISAALRVARGLPPDAMVVVFIPDAGDRYLSKIYNDDWMRRHQYWEAEWHATAEQIVRWKQKQHPGSRLVTAVAGETAQRALRLMQDNEISQLPVFDEGVCVGTVREDEILNLALRGADLATLVLRECMKAPLPSLDLSAPIDRVTYLLTNESPAVLINMGDGTYEILTKYDLIEMLASLTDAAGTARSTVKI